MKVPNLMLNSGLMAIRSIIWTFALVTVIVPLVFSIIDSESVPIWTNAITFVVGILIVVFGIWVRKITKYAYFSEKYYEEKKKIIIILGVITLFPWFFILFGKYVDPQSQLPKNK